MDFSTDNITCPNCNESHEPSVFEDAGVAIFEDGISQATCPNCGQLLEIQTNIITEWGVREV